MMKEYRTIEEVDLDELKKEAKLIHYFGLGFIQVKLSDTTRMHFYTAMLPPIIAEEDLHDHRYDFSSGILHGTLRQEIFALTEGDSHILEEESCKENTPMVKPGVPCGIKKIHEQEFTKGSSYVIDHDTFHRISATDAITFIKRGDYKKEFARVAHANTVPKVCPFSKKIPEGELWEIVEAMIMGAGV